MQQNPADAPAESNRADRTSRRSFLQATSATALTGTGVAAVARRSSAQEDVPELDFRDGMPAVDEAPQDAGEVLFYVHGYDSSGDSQADAATLLRTAANAGYDHPGVAVTWSDSGFVFSALDGAEQDGRKFAQWLTDFVDQNPDTTIRTVAHSMGGVVTMSYLGALDGVTVDTAAMIGGFVRSSSVCSGTDRYRAISESCEAFYNYYSRDDGVAMIGSEGAQCGDGSTPDNYTDVDVTDSVDGHSGYRSSEGCVSAIVENFD